ncbi:MAG: hypothetical protein H7293_21070, partial [Candidatus Saccharibacteria bacterium]|nr:hypothetical protein [Rhodoferax sp.]
MPHLHSLPVRATTNCPGTPLLPLGAMLLAGSLTAMAQPVGQTEVKSLKPITIVEKADTPEGKDA